MLQNLIVVAFLVVPNATIVAVNKEGLPKEAKSTADILKVVDAGPDYYRGAEWVESAILGKKTFIVWFNPNSGRAACHLHGYGYDAQKKQWVRHLERVFDGTHRVSVEVDAEITIRDVDGKMVYKGKLNG